MTAKHPDEKIVVRLGPCRFAVGPGAGEPFPPDESPTAKRYKRRLAAGETLYGLWHNPDTCCGYPAYDVLRFHPDGRVFRAARAVEVGDEDPDNEDSYEYTGEWVEESYSPISIEAANFGRMSEIIKPEDLDAKLADCRLWNREWYGLEKTDG